MPLPASSWLAGALAGFLTFFAPCQTWRELPKPVPLSIAAWDPSRQRVLLLDTGNPNFLIPHRIYEWDGTTTRERIGELTGQPQIQYLLCDPLSPQMIAIAADRRVGTWSGGAWAWRGGGTAPQGPLAVAIDPQRRRLVTLGGGVHEWDGQRWWAVGTVPVPGFGPANGLIYDPLTRRCHTYGAAGAATANTHAWDGFAWSVIDTNSAPGPRVNHRFAIDPSTGQPVLYGGSSLVADTWTWDGRMWRPVPATGGPGLNAAPHLVADDRNLLLFATAGVNAGTIWRLLAGTWTRVSELWGTTAARPNLVWANDRVNGTLVTFGGLPHTPVPSPGSQTAVFDRQWQIVQPTTVPPARALAQLAWSEVDQRVVMFSGLSGPMRADTWLWTGRDWQALQPNNAPPARHNAVMAEDPAGGVMLYGGANGPTHFGDHWYWNGTDWSSVSPTTLPPARAYTASAWDPVRRQVVMYGGYSDIAVFLTETWLWDGSNWTRRITQHTPTLTTSAAFHPHTQRVALTSRSFAFEWDGVDWVQQSWSTGQIALVTDHRRGQLLSLAAPGAHVLSHMTAGTSAFGTGCSAGAAPDLAAVDAPTLDTGFAIECMARAPTTMAFLQLGLAAQNVPIGASCRSLIAQELGVTLLLTNGGGIARLPLPIPVDRRLLGLRFFAQGAVWDPPHSPIGSVTFSAGLMITIGE